MSMLNTLRQWARDGVEVGVAVRRQPTQRGLICADKEAETGRVFYAAGVRFDANDVAFLDIPSRVIGLR